MKVKLLVSRIGPDVNDAPGDEIEVTAEEGRAMFEAIPPQAVPVKPTNKPEKAVN